MCKIFSDNKVMNIKEKIRVVPDFPTPGIQFYDITTLFSDAQAFRETIDAMVQIARKFEPDVVVALESRGFFFGPTIAYQLGVPFVPVRKKGKLPYTTYQETYLLEYGSATMEIHTDACSENQKVLIVDDVLATGGSMAAAIAAQLLNINNDVILESLTTFAGVEHRLQYVATVRGVRWINDSKATNVNSCWYALEAMTTPTVLILGGKDKGNDYSEIDQLVLDKCHTLVFMGLHNEKLIEHFSALGYKPAAIDSQKSDGSKRYIDTNTLADAVRACYNVARDGDTVLLSPCCASFDLFKSYEDRGEQFMAAVRNL